MSGLLALLDDVAALAKAAAASLDDVAAQSAKAGSKAAGVVIDDAAVTPQYVDGIDPKRELPVVWRIAKGSLVNKLVFLLPVALLLSALAPGLITPLLMLGGAYLSYEGGEKIWHLLAGGRKGGHEAGHDGASAARQAPGDPLHLEEEKARGAIKTDFILSAEIMTITLAAIPPGAWWKQALVLAVVGVAITVAVYGTVALIVKADDVGLWLARKGRLALVRAFGRGLVKAMPVVMQMLSAVGTVAMLWVGGAILVHGLGDLGMHGPADAVEHAAESFARVLPQGLAPGGAWLAEAALYAVAGLGTGLLLLPLVAHVLAPVARRLSAAFGPTGRGGHG